MNIHPEFRVFAHKRPSGYSDANILEDIKVMSSQIESLYGPGRDDWIVRFVVFADEEAPCIFYPDGFAKTVGVRLVDRALDNIDYAKFQLAHELVHCLAPSGGVHGNVAEEGMAAFYQTLYSCQYLGNRVVVGDKRYKSALNALLRLLSKHGNVLIKLREIEPNIWKWTSDTFTLAGVKADPELKKSLLTPFADYKGI